MNNQQFQAEYQLEEWESAREISTDLPAKIEFQSSDDNSVFIQQAINTMMQSISRLQADFETKIKYDESKDRTIDAMHRELQNYREDLSLKILRPLILDIVSLYDDLNLLDRKYSESEQSVKVGKFTSDLKTFATDIEEIVSRYSFEFYQVDSDRFDRSLQTTQKVVNTDNPHLDKQTIDRIRPGLRYGDRVVRPELVTAYRYVAPSQSNPPSNSAPTYHNQFTDTGATHNV
jgi:molecular chaperone GrpE